MQTSGIVRRIDDLGRIVIPKEIRRMIRISSGDNLEIIINDNEDIILRKYNQIDKLQELSLILTYSVFQALKKDIIITNTDTIVASSNKEYQKRKISTNLKQLIHDQKDIKEVTEEIIDPIESFLFSPIIVNGDPIGSVIIIDGYDKFDINAIKIIATFLSKNLEN